MAQYKYCWEFLIIYFFSLVFFFGSHLFSTSAILVSSSDLHDSPPLFILSGCSPLSNLFHIYHFHILLLLVSLPSYLQYLELSAWSPFPKCPQFSPFHDSPGVGSWGIRNTCAVLWCADVSSCVLSFSWLASGELAHWAQLSWLFLYSGHYRNFSSLSSWKFSQYLAFLNLIFSVKVKVQLMNSRDVLEARWWGKMTQCVHINLVFIWNQAKMKVQSTWMCENKQVTLCTWLV